jgi:hypothetical protein
MAEPTIAASLESAGSSSTKDLSILSPSISAASSGALPLGGAPAQSRPTGSGLICVKQRRANPRMLPSPRQSRRAAMILDRSHAMPLYYFRIQSGPYSGASDHGMELADREAAWKELTGVCGDMIGSIARHLQQNAEWQMELLDEYKKPVFRIRLVAESFEPQ